MATEITSQRDASVVPSWMTREECVQQYLLGRAWYERSATLRIPGPLTEEYLLENLKWMSAKGLFSGNSDEWAMEHVSFLLGMLSQEA